MTPNTHPMNGPSKGGTPCRQAAWIFGPDTEVGADDVTTVSRHPAPPTHASSALLDPRTFAGAYHRAVFDVCRFVGAVVRGVRGRSGRRGLCRVIGGGVVLCVVGVGVGACGSSGGGGVVSGGQSSVERQMSGEYILNSDGTLSKVPVVVHEPQLQSNAYTYSAFGAEQAAKHYLALMDYAWETGDTTSVREFVNTDACMPCVEFIERIEDLYASGGWSHGGKDRVVKTHETIDVSEVTGVPDSFAVRFTVHSDTYQIYRDGELSDHPESSALLDLLMQWDGHNWHVYEQEASDAPQE